MPVLDPQAAVEAALVADVKTAWDIDSQHRVSTNPPELKMPIKEADLPVAVILTSSVGFNSVTGGAGSLDPTFRCAILGRFFKPQGVELMPLKRQKVNALLDLIKATPFRYHGCSYRRSDLNTTLQPDESDAGRSYFEVLVMVQFHA